MKLLLDENLSVRLVRLLAAPYPDSTHPELLGLRGASDTTLWTLARERGFVLVSKDDDFRQRSLMFGHPPKVVWLGVGNVPTAHIADLLIRHVTILGQFHVDAQASILILR